MRTMSLTAAALALCAAAGAPASVDAAPVYPWYKGSYYYPGKHNMTNVTLYKKKDEYPCGTYYPKGYMWKPWTWKYYKYSKYGYYAGDCKNKTKSEYRCNLTPDPVSGATARKYVGLAAFESQDNYVLAAKIPEVGVNENPLLSQSRNGITNYKCTCYCEAQATSVGCSAYTLAYDSKQNTARVLNSNVTTPNVATYFPSLATDKYHKEACGKYLGAASAVQLFVGSNTSDFGPALFDLDSSIDPHFPGGPLSQTIWASEINYGPDNGVRPPLVIRAQQAETTCVAPTTVTTACSNVCDASVAAGVIPSNQFDSKC